MARKYDGPRLTHGKVHYPEGRTPQSGNFAGSIKPGAKLPAKASTPTANMLPQNVGKGPGPAPTFRAPEPRHSVMKALEGGQRGSGTLMVKPDPNSPVNRKKAQIMRERTREARATQAQWLAQRRAQEKQQAAPHAPGGPKAPPPSAGQPAANLGPGQGLGSARRGFGRDAQANPFRAGR